MFITLSVEMISLVYTYFKAYQIVQSNHVQFVTCPLYANKGIKIMLSCKSERI